MMTGSIGRLVRLAGVLALAGFTVGCAGQQQGPAVSAPAGFGKDPASRAERLVSYCDRMAKKGEMVTALGLCARAHEIDPDDPETLMKIAALLTTMNRQQAAVQTYNALLERHPRHHEARYSLGKLYMESGDVALASIEFEHAMNSDPKDPRPYNALGILQDQAGAHDAAQALYRKALEQDPLNTSVRNNLGLSLALNGKRDEAIAVLAELAVDTEGSQGSERTVLRNLEAAYTARATAGPASQAAPLNVPGNVPDAAPLEPVAREPLDEPREDPVAEPAAAKASDDLPPAPADGAPTPLFVPPAAAGNPQQSGARSTEPAPRASGPQDSVILAAAELLMKPPAWADFEPGALIGAEPPTAVAPDAALPQSGALDDAGLDPEKSDPVELSPMEMGEPARPGEYSLSMLVTNGGATIA